MGEINSCLLLTTHYYACAPLRKSTSFSNAQFLSDLHVPFHIRVEQGLTVC